MLQRIPAKRLADLELDEKLFKADFDLSARYDSLSTELERLSLLGIGAYGFMLTAMKEGELSSYAQAVKGHPFLPMLPAVGLLTLALAAGCALSCNYLNSRCLKLQVDILRYLRRVNDDLGWTPKEQEVNAAVLTENRAKQKQMLSLGRNLAFLATVALITGASLTAITFVVVLLAKLTIPGTPAVLKP